MPKTLNEIVKQLDHKHDTIGLIDTSGETYVVGTHTSQLEQCVFMLCEEQVDPTYMNALEARMLGYALLNAANRMEGKD